MSFARCVGHLFFLYFYHAVNGTVINIGFIHGLGFIVEAKAHSMKKNPKELSRQDLISNNELFELVEEIVSLGHWQWDLITNDVIWSKNLYHIFDHDWQVPVTFHVYRDYIHPDDREYVARKINEFLLAKKAYAIHHRIVQPNGTVKYVELQAKFRFDRYGEPVEMIGTCLDTTDRTLAEQRAAKMYAQLQQKNQELEQFLTWASHDLKEPLNSIKSLTELLQSSALKDNRQQDNEVLAHLQQTVNRMDTLITDILQYGRLGQNKEKQLVALPDIMQEVISDLHHTIQQTRAEINVQPLPTVQADRLQIRLLFQNLISNALKFSRKETHPVIDINSFKNNGFWVFEIRDNGIGIPQEDHKVIFNIFKRLNMVNTSGTGLGLAHCKKVVQLHGGDIWVTSQQGKGATFSFTLPI